MADNGSILVTGAAGQLGAVGRTVTGLLLERGLPVRAMVRREDDRAAALRAAGAEVVVGDLLEPADVSRVVRGCGRVYFGMSVSAGYLEASVTMAAVARDVGVNALVNMSQMTVSQMSLQHTTPSPQQRQHWLSEQALAWSGLPVVTIRPTVFLEGFFLPLTGPTVRDRGRIELPFGRGKTSPVAAADVARVVAAVLADPGPDLRTHRSAVAGHARGRPGVLGRAEPRGHVLGYPPRGLGTGAEKAWVAGAPDPASGDDGRVEPGGSV
jgi:NAD(P)H dehydrogenase (quinone)